MMVVNPKGLAGYASYAHCPAANAIVPMHTQTCDWCGGKHMVEHKGTVIHGTMRHVDVIPALWDYLLVHNPSFSLPIDDFALYEKVRAADYDWDLSDDDMEGAGYLLEALFSGMDALAPEGYYFGAHEGDGSDYGFWLGEGMRECDECGTVTDAGEYPDWINGKCDECDPDILSHPENLERLETSSD